MEPLQPWPKPNQDAGMSPASRHALEYQITGLKNECDRLESKVRSRNRFIFSSFVLVAIALFSWTWMSYTEVITVNYSNESLGVQLAKAKDDAKEAKFWRKYAELRFDNAKLEIDRLTNKVSKLMPAAEGKVAEVANKIRSEELVKKSEQYNGSANFCFCLFVLGVIAAMVFLGSNGHPVSILLSLAMIILGIAGTIYCSVTADSYREQAKQSVTISADQPKN